MISFVLHLKTSSAIAPGSGESRAGVLDREVVHDDLGLPVIPARRLKGILREAALDVHDNLNAFPLWIESRLETTDALFGETGQGQPGPFRLGDARLPDHEELRRWLKDASSRGDDARYFHPEAVLMAYTEQRSQTAMDPQSGGPQQDSLRVTRVLRPDLEFVAEGQLVVDDSDSNANTLLLLALACRSARRMGLSRNRGLGRVDISLECSGMAPLPTEDELTAELLAAAERRQ